MIVERSVRDARWVLDASAAGVPVPVGDGMLNGMARIVLALADALAGAERERDAIQDLAAQGLAQCWAGCVYVVSDGSRLVTSMTPKGAVRKAAGLEE